LFKSVANELFLSLFL